MDRKRRISPQTKVKLRQAAKKRKRAPKGGPHAGQFQAGKLHAAFAKTAALSFHAMPFDPNKSTGENYREGVREGLEKGAKRERTRLARVSGDIDQLRTKEAGRLKEIEARRKHIQGVYDQVQEKVEPWESKTYQIPESDQQRSTRHRRFQENVSKDWGRLEQLYDRYTEQNRRDGLGTRAAQRRALERAYREVDLESGHKFSQGQYRMGIPEVREALQKVRSNKPQPGLYARMSPEEESSYKGQMDEAQLAQSGEVRRAQRGVYPGSSPIQGPIRYRQGKYDTPSTAKTKLHREDRDWLDNEVRNNKGSPFFNSEGREHDPGSYRRLKTFTDLLQQGYGIDEAYQYIQSGGGNVYKGRRASTAGASTLEEKRADQAKETIENKLKPKARGRKPQNKYKGTAPSHETMSQSMRAPNVDKISELRSKFPDKSEADLFKFQTDQAKAVDEHMLQQNARWAHEARRQRYLDRKTSDTGADKNRVIFFTTNAGAPTASVPANSLIGQYVVKKRKKMVVDDKLAQRWEVKGEFPAAVRDQHLIEISTGLRIGAEGRYGVFHNTGWRKGVKRSKGFGKQIPVGAQVLRDPTGRPVYDDKGNIRYTEGYTRPFNVGTDRDVGLRVFLG